MCSAISAFMANLRGTKASLQYGLDDAVRLFVL